MLRRPFAPRRLPVRRGLRGAHLFAHHPLVLLGLLVVVVVVLVVVSVVRARQRS